MLSTEPAYSVPFVVDRSAAPRLYRLRNMSTEPVRAISLTHLGNGYAPPLAVRCLAPGAELSIAVFGASQIDTGILVVRWRRPNDAEYLWRLNLSPMA